MMRASQLFSMTFVVIVSIVAVACAYIKLHGHDLLHVLGSPSGRLFSNPPKLAAFTCQAAVAPSAAELRNDKPMGWDGASLARKRQGIDVVKSQGGEEDVVGFEGGKCVVGAYSRPLSASKRWNRSACIEHCLEEKDCLGVLWGRVEMNDGARFQCFLSGIGDDDTVITYPTCDATWLSSCPKNVTYKALTDFAPHLQCWQRHLRKCFSIEEMSSIQAERMLALMKDSEGLVEALVTLERLKEQASAAMIEFRHSPLGLRVVKFGSLFCIAFAGFLLLRMVLSCLCGRRPRNGAFASQGGMQHLSQNLHPVAPNPLQQVSIDENLFANLWGSAPPVVPPIVVNQGSIGTGALASHSPWVCASPAVTLAQPTSFVQQPAPSSPWAVQQIPGSPMLKQIPRSPLPPSSPLLTRNTPTPTRGNTSPSLVQQSMSMLPIVVENPSSAKDVVSSGSQPSPQELSLVALLSHADLATLKSLNGFGPKTAATFIAKRPSSGFNCLQDLVSQGLVTPRILEKLKSNV